jgi:hypothetical protein
MAYSYPPDVTIALVCQVFLGFSFREVDALGLWFGHVHHPVCRVGCLLLVDVARCTDIQPRLSPSGPGCKHSDPAKIVAQAS